MKMSTFMLAAVASISLLVGSSSGQIMQIGNSLNITNPITVPLMAGTLKEPL